MKTEYENIYLITEEDFDNWKGLFSQEDIGKFLFTNGVSWGIGTLDEMQSLKSGCIFNEIQMRSR